MCNIVEEDIEEQLLRCSCASHTHTYFPFYPFASINGSTISSPHDTVAHSSPFRFVRPFELPLLAQSVLMIAAQLFMLHLCVELQEPSVTKRHHFRGLAPLGGLVLSLHTHAYIYIYTHTLARVNTQKRSLLFYAPCPIPISFNRSSVRT